MCGIIYVYLIPVSAQADIVLAYYQNILSQSSLFIFKILNSLQFDV